MLISRPVVVGEGSASLPNAVTDPLSDPKPSQNIKACPRLAIAMADFLSFDIIYQDHAMHRGTIHHLAHPTSGMLPRRDPAA